MCMFDSIHIRLLVVDQNFIFVYLKKTILVRPTNEDKEKLVFLIKLIKHQLPYETVSASIITIHLQNICKIHFQ